MNTPSEIVIYEGTEARVEVRLGRETVWLTQEQMGQLFGRERSIITKHIRNAFTEGELEREAICAKFAHTAADGKTYQVEHYNLDVIISVGYRVKSVQLKSLGWAAAHDDVIGPDGTAPAAGESATLEFKQSAAELVRACRA